MIKESIKRKITTTVVVATLVLANSGSVFAAHTTFSKALVEGNRYTYVTKKDKETSYKYVKLRINTMYTDDNKVASNYKKSKAQLRGYDGSSYVRCTISDDYGKTVEKGQDERFTLLKKYQAKGKTIKYYAKGNNPDLDCKISGSMYVDQES